MPEPDSRLDRLRACLDAQKGRFEALRGAGDLRAYLSAPAAGADEERLTEPVLASIIERVLGFPPDAYFPQFGKGGQKPDFTPIDLVAHRFVLDAKSSTEDLGPHEPQIRRYMQQRSLDFGVLFNLRELRVYRKAARSHDPSLSFLLLPLWEQARGEALIAPELEAFERFCDTFAYRKLSVADKIAYVRQLDPWATLLAAREPVEVDVEALVERLRRLSLLLADDADAQDGQLDELLALNPGRERKLVGELEALALDISPGISIEALPKTAAAWRTADGLPRQVWRQYLLRVAYLALTRIMLYRAWEDVEFVRSYLYDGGFDDAYERLSGSVRDVLREAFQEGAERYRWLYGGDNNYDWYRPREHALVEVIYLLAPIPLGKLDADVLGGLYVSYVDEIDRDRLGQFFTPRVVVRFMLDRAGFAGADGVFHVEGDERRPKRILDFATGSGGFLVEAARRVIDAGATDTSGRRELLESLAGISRGFVGGEISPFPYYLTEVNLLLQVSRLLGQLTVEGADAPRFVLGVLHVDTLTAKSAPDASLEGVDPKLRADHGELVGDERFDLVPLDGEKLETYRDLRRDGTFDLVVGNPPYITEANNKPLFDRLKAIAAWKPIYKGKTDYLYYFLWLAVEKLKPGGRLCVITPAGWMNAGSADFLREKLASELQLDELFLFGSYRLFADEQGPAPTPTVESLILVATKVPADEGHMVRVVALESEAEAGNPARDDLLAEMTRRAARKAGRSGGIHVHELAQAQLVSRYPWPVKFGSEDVAAQVVAHLTKLVDDDSEPVEQLQQGWKVFQGIQTGADAYTKRIQRRLTADIKGQLTAAGSRVGDPILELPAGEEKQPPWSAHPHLLGKAPESRAILYGALDDDDYAHLVLLGREEPPADVQAALERWRPLLATRAEIARNPRRKWWETAWRRDPRDLQLPKVIALYRTDRGRFALDETGEWQPSIKTTVIVGRDPGAPVAYLCGLLNSELLDLWYAVRGKTPWHVRRNYEPKRMNEMPYRRPDGDARAEEIAELVRGIAANRRALLPHRPVVRNLARIVKDPWKDGPVEIDRAALVAELPPGETVSVRTDSGLDAHVEAKLGKPKRETATLVTFRNGRVEGEPARLDLLEAIMGGKAPSDLLAVLLPKDIAAFDKLVTEHAQVVRDLLAEGRRLVEEVERLVCGLYDVPADLTEEIITHAIRRAGGPDVDSEA